MLQTVDEEVYELEEIEEIHELVERYRHTQDQIRDIWLKKFDEMAEEIARPLGRLEIAIDRLGEDQGAFVERLLYEVSKPLRSAVQNMQSVNRTLKEKHTDLHELLHASQGQNQAVLSSVVKLTQRLAEQQGRQLELLDQLKHESQRRSRSTDKLKVALGAVLGTFFLSAGAVALSCFV